MRNIFLQLVLRMFRLRKSGIPTKRKGIILILIDGLGYKELIYALKKRYCPFFIKLLTVGYSLHPYYCGPPSSTTATEAELFYGNHADVPGFTWYDRRLQRFVRGNRGAEIEAFEKSFRKKTEYLKNGSCILGVFSGGATQLDITGKDLDSSRPFKIFRKMHLVAFIMNPLRLTYTAALILKSLFFSTVSLFRKGSMKMFFRILKDNLTKILLGNIATYFAELELLRETPILFIDFLLYDEFAHEYGMSRRTALSSLKLINWYCQSLYNISKKTRRRYDILIFSDHGQTKSTPFDGLAAGSVEHLMSRATGIPKEYVIKTLGNPPKKLLNGKKIFFVPAGSTLHIYFAEAFRNPLSEKNLSNQYPDFIKRLMNERQIGWILIRTGRSSQILKGKEGEAVFRHGKVQHISGELFPGIKTHPRTLDELATYATYKNNGDVVVFGNIMPDGRVCSFEDHKSTHGGFIGEMTEPFIMTNNTRILRGIKKNDSMAHIFKVIRLSYPNNKL